MCAILDASARDEVFGDAQSPAGEAFHARVTSQQLRLVVGGKLLKELEESQGFKRWFSEAERVGIQAVQIVSDSKVEEKQAEIKSEHLLKSGDEHIIALAQISGARLLYTNDGRLQEDFKNPQLIKGPRGKIYTTKESKSYGRAHRQLLGNRNLCRMSPT